MQRENAARWTSRLGRAFQIYLALLAVFLGAYMSLVDTDMRDPQLVRINEKTAETLKELVKTKFFRIIRINIDNGCPFWAQQRLCASGGCGVCRCSGIDVPPEWKQPQKTDLIQRGGAIQGVEHWALQRTQNGNATESLEKGIWHVEDLENDKGQYFDIDLNKEAYTAYDGRPIWDLVYKENCFSGKFQNMCHEEKILYNIISGLHTSISTHLSYFYKDFKPFVKPEELPYYLNESLYFQRVGNHPERMANLYFLYSVLLSSLSKVKDKLVYYNIDSGNITEDFRSKVLLLNYIEQLNNFKVPKQLQAFSSVAKPFIAQYQRYVHNISRIMDCVECEKCRLFGKMQTYGLGTAMKVIFGYTDLKRNELVAFVNALNKISMSIEINRMLVKSPKQIAFVYLMIYTWVGLCLFSFLFSALSIYKSLGGKVKSMFNHAFPIEATPKNSVPAPTRRTKQD